MRASLAAPVPCLDDGATRRYLYADARGSVVFSSTSTGGAARVNSYDPYGVPGSTNSGRFQYTGQIWLAEAGLYYYKARMYSPTLGRFLQTDPIGYEDNVNLYAYVGNDPVNGVDFLGLCEVKEDGSRTGVCPTGENSELVVNGAMADPNSAIATKDAELIENGQLIEVAVAIHVRGVDAAGTIDEGDGSPLVVLDVAETIRSQNVDQDGNVLDENLNYFGELLEHEVIGEAQAVLDGDPPEVGHQAGLDAENALRAARENSFRRTTATNDLICNSRGQGCR